MKEQDFKLVDIGKIIPSKTNPRSGDDHKLFTDFVNSIREKGIQVPLKVRPLNGKLEIVYGHRRHRAAKELGLKEIPVIIEELSDDEAFELQMIENLQRLDIHPLDEAEGFVRMQSNDDRPIEHLAAKIGKDVSYITQRKKLTDLIPSAKKAFKDDALQLGHALLICRLQPEDQERCLKFALNEWQQYDGKFKYDNTLNPEAKDKPGTKGSYRDPGKARTVCSVNDLEKFINSRINLDLRNAAFDTKDEMLVAKAGA